MNKFTFRNNIAPAREMFPKRPDDVSVYFYMNPETDADFLLTGDGEVQMDVFDCHYAILNLRENYEWGIQFDDICKNNADAGSQYMALRMSWAVYCGQFTIVIDEGHLTGAFEDFCDKLGIDSQFHIDQPACQTDDYEYTDEEGGYLDPEECWASDQWIEDNVYTGAGENFPHLIRALHEIQENK